MPGITYSNPPSPILQSHALPEELISLSKRVLDIIYRYKCPLPKDVLDRSDEGELIFTSLIYRSIKANKAVRLVLPAFPFKSPNSESKVLGVRPDQAEHVALANLNGMCKAIEDIYSPGARLVIVSDGLVYNDLLGVPDKVVWSYGQELRQIASKQSYSNIEFARLKDLLGVEWLEDGLDEMSYVATASTVRLMLMNKYGSSGWDSKKAESVKNNENKKLTYCGYLKFLETDLAAQYPITETRSKSQFKKGVEKIAKAMLQRGEAFAKAVRENFPDHVRLSIHPSTGEDKISIKVLPLASETITPWHSCVAYRLNGSLIAGHRKKFEDMDEFELVEDEGRPVYFREKSKLFDWGPVPVAFEPQYPCGLIIRPTGGKHALSIEDINGPKVRLLAEQNSPVILRGFSRTRNRDLFVCKATEIGKPQSWKFGLVLEVKDKGTETSGLNNVLSQEWMPFHFDGLFKTEKRISESGKEYLVSKPPRFQLFTAVTPSPRNTGFTLFSSSRLLFEHLPRKLPLSRLEQMSWSVSTKSFDQTVLNGLRLVVRHPTTGLPCLQYHERWPQHKTRFDPTEVTIEDGDQSVCDVLETLLHDRRVCYWHTWQEGDLLVSDNVGMMHTRSSFTSETARELWRIHID